MAFTWKDKKDIWKGEGIYHLTFVVAGRRPLLGKLVTEYPNEDIPTVKRFYNINAKMDDCASVGELVTEQPNEDIPTVKRFYNINAKMDDCASVGELVTEQPNEDIPTMKRFYNINAKMDDCASVGEKAKIAWVNLTPYGKAVDDMLRHYDETHEGITVCKRIVMDDHLHIVLWVKRTQYSPMQHKPQSILQIAYGMRVQFTHMAQDMGVWPKGVRVEGALHAEKGAGHIFEKQFVRTLSRKGQLRSMIDYVTLNPYRKYMRQQNPELFTMHKDTEAKGLRFKSMGNHWLQEWPERQVVKCSRDISEEELQTLMKATLLKAKTGTVTYTAAISKGEQMIARAVREAGYPLVILLMDGFPPVGSENEKYYKPGGVYFDACNAGKLLLLEAYSEAYEHAEIIALTDAELQRKAVEKHITYKPLPHDCKRWRMIAGNVMLRYYTSEWR